MNRFPLMVAALGVMALPAVAMAEEISGPIPDASRVVSIGGSITEIIYDLGEEGRLVGRDTTSVFPEAAHNS